MKIFTTFFNLNNITEYSRMFNVLKYSCYKLNLNLNILDKPDFNLKDNSSETQGWKNNNILKMISWADAFSQLNRGEEVLFIDSDTFIKEDVSYIFDNDFDIAYTDDGSPCENCPGISTINTGVMFFRVSDLTKTFVNSWKEACVRMYEDNLFWEEWSNKLYGLTQPAFLYTLDKIKIKKLVLPRSKYNCIPKSKFNFKEIEIGHLQDPYWRAVLGTSYKLNLNMDYVTYWRNLEIEYNNSILS